MLSVFFYRMNQHGSNLSVSRDMKHDILQKLAEYMYSFKAYPTEEDFAEVATALISKHHQCVVVLWVS